MITVQKFCCCLSLTKGVILIGCLKILFAILISTQIIYNTVRDNSGEEVASNNAGWVFYLFLIKKVIIQICVILLAIFLILGANKRNCNFILPWLIWTVVITVLNLFSLLRFFEVPDMKFLIQEVIMICITVYFWIVVYSLYRLLRQEQVNNKMSWRMHTSV